MTNTKIQTGKPVYDLEERTLRFAQRTKMFVRSVPRSIADIEYAKQLIRSSGSVGANYIEANESLSKKDFAMRIKICRKEAKESGYWLRLIGTEQKEKESLIQEATELVKIFHSIAEKSS